MTRQSRKDTWVIDVCLTCGKKAQWPFCEHREDNGSWYETIVVRGTWHPKEDQ